MTQGLFGRYDATHSEAPGVYQPDARPGERMRAAQPSFFLRAFFVVLGGGGGFPAPIALPAADSQSPSILRRCGAGPVFGLFGFSSIMAIGQNTPLHGCGLSWDTTCRRRT